jgi:uncharacterized membrane protein YdjX (TVP38/TMEM64 family)
VTRTRFVQHGQVVTTGLLIGIGLSRQLPALFAGYDIGVVAGTVQSVVTVILDGRISFNGGSLLLRAFLAGRHGARIRRLDGLTREHTLTTTSLLRQLPVGNNRLSNLADGTSAVRGVPFFPGSSPGYFPQMLVVALAGCGSQLQEFRQSAITVVTFVVSALPGIRLLGRYRGFDSMGDPAGGVPDDSYMARRA